MSRMAPEAQTARLPLLPQRHLLNPKFEVYRLHADERERACRSQLLFARPFDRTLAGRQSLVYDEARVRTYWNALVPAAPDDAECVAWFVDSSPAAIGIAVDAAGGMRVQRRVHMSIADPAPEASYPPQALALPGGRLLLSDGGGLISAVYGYDAAVPGLVAVNLDEGVPALLLHATSRDATAPIDFVACWRREARPRYLIRQCRIDSNGRCEVVAAYTSAHIPELARLAYDDSQAVLVTASTEAIQPLVAPAAGAAAAAEDVPAGPPPHPYYVWTQTESDVTVSLALAPGVVKSQIHVHFDRETLRVNGLEGGVVDSNLYAPVDPAACTWTMSQVSAIPGHEAGGPLVLDIFLEKSNPRQHWPHVFAAPDPPQVACEIFDPSERSRALEQLGKFTLEDTEKLAAPSLDMDLDDSQPVMPAEYYTVQVWGSETRSVGGVQLVGHSVEPSGAQLVLERDVDALVYSLDSAAQMLHTYTAPALAYIAASKQQRKYVLVDASHGRSIVAEDRGSRGGSSTIYVYECAAGAATGAQYMFRLPCDLFGCVCLPDGTWLILGQDSSHGVLYHLAVV